MELGIELKSLLARHVTRHGRVAERLNGGIGLRLNWSWLCYFEELHRRIVV